MAKDKKSGSILLQLGGAALAGYGIYLLFGREKSKETLIERERILSGGSGVFAGASSGSWSNPSAFGSAAMPFSYKQGCTDPNFQEYDPSAVDVCPPNVYAMGDCFGTTENAFKKQICLTPKTQVEILGCTDNTATNYNEKATKNDGSCQYEEDLFGCIDPTSENFDPLATEDDGSCFYDTPILGCTDATATNYNPNAGQDDGSCAFLPPTLPPQPAPVFGCTDPAANNYNPNAGQDDGSCAFLPPPLPPQPAPVFGCTDPTAVNYNPNATFDFGNCVYLPPPLPPTPAPAVGCTDPSAFNFSEQATIDDGSCIPAIIGCTCPEATNYNPNANTDNNNCKVCTIPEADNFASNCPTSAPDNNACIIGGCNDPNASNYNPQATYNNNTCSYPTGGGGGNLMPTLGSKSQMSNRQVYSASPTTPENTTRTSTSPSKTRSFDGQSNGKLKGYYDALDARKRVNDGTFA